jgi:GNAT superfamily N-acetyltransferase
MKIIEVSSKSEIKEFLNLPFKIYKNDKNWIPHLQQDIEKVFDPTKNKAHANGKITRWILQDSNNHTIGRIAAFIDFKDVKNGGIGFFECINDKEAAFELLNTSKKWLEKLGAELIDGPINFGEKNMFWGLLVENFKDPNSYSMNYNPSYYINFFEDFGFKIYYKQFMYKRDMITPVGEVFEKKHQKIIKDGNYKIENVKKLTLDQIADNFRTVYNAAWGGHNNFKNMTEKTARKIMTNIKPIYDPEIMVFVYYKNKPVAFYINIPELNEIFKFVNGNLNWIGKLKFLYHKMMKTPTTMVGIVFGVDKAFQGKGVEAAMIKWSQKSFTKNTQYSKTVLTWVGDFNPKMIKVCENLGADVYRTYHTYRYLFDREKPFERCPIVE